jgi:FkbM family methyltransferase
MAQTLSKYFGLVRNVQNWAQYLRFKIQPDRSRTYTFRLRPVPIELRMPGSGATVMLFKEIFMREAYEPALRAIRAERPVILDVGGNLGYFALYAFLRYPQAKVHSFEPIATNLKYLVAHRQANPQLDWQVHPVAVADRTGTLDFYYDESETSEGISTNASLYSATEIGTVTAQHQRLQVEAVRLADWFEKHGLDGCDLLKLDCEGAEYGILYTLPERYFARIPAIVAEAHPMKNPGETLGELADFLRAKGYAVRTADGQMIYAARP